jgi:hypothetical protein
MSTEQIRTWLASDDSPDFVELVRHNVVLPADAEPWRAVVQGDLPPLAPQELRVISAAGRNSSAPSARSTSRPRTSNN